MIYFQVLIKYNCINILQNFGNKTCTYYAYRFCNNIENPLIKGYSLDYEDLGNEIFYELQSNHDYTLGTNSLHVWINGVKQEIRETIFTKEYDNGIIRKVKGYAIPKPTDYNGNALLNMPTPYYIIETPETGEYKSCRQEYLDTTINKNTYYTVNSLLSPGIVTVYVDGYRQPKESFIVNDMNTLTFIEPLINDMNNIYKVGDKNNQEKYIEVISRSKVLVEIRQDFSLKETTVQLTEENIEECMKGNTLVITVDTIFNNNKKLLASLFLVQESEINIFINGANYGNDFTLIRNQEMIILNNNEIVSIINAGDYLTFEWR